MKPLSLWRTVTFLASSVHEVSSFQVCIHPPFCFTHVCTPIQVNAAGHQRELETLRRSAKEQRRQIHDLQELLANREREHIKEMEKYKPLGAHRVSKIILISRLFDVLLRGGGEVFIPCLLLPSKKLIYLENSANLSSEHNIGDAIAQHLVILNLAKFCKLSNLPNFPLYVILY